MPVPVNWIEGLGATSTSSPADVDEDVDVEDKAVSEELLLLLVLALALMVEPSFELLPLLLTRELARVLAETSRC